MAGSVLDIPGNIDLEAKAAMLAQRRTVLLSVIGSTPASNAAVTSVLNDGFLETIKAWLDDVLNSVVGGVDLLLHLLDSVALLPVTKDMITTSGAGKAITAIKSHSICKGTPNEDAIKERCAKVKEEWSASVRARKQQKPVNSPPKPAMTSAKRPFQGGSPPAMASLPKKAKLASSTSPATTKKKTSLSLSSMLKKVGDKPGTVSNKNTDVSKQPMSAAEAARQKTKERDEEIQKKLKDAQAIAKEEAPVVIEEKKETDDKVESEYTAAAPSASALNSNSKSKQVKSVSWADQSGQALEQSHEFSGEQNPSEKAEKKPERTLASWSERRKRDRMREKELLAEHKAQFRKAKLFDVDPDDMELIAPAMTATVRWSKPTPLPLDPKNPPFQVDSKEYVSQTARMASVPAVIYLSDADVPSNPIPLTGIEQALEFTTQASATAPESIPWVPPPPQPQVPVPAATILDQMAGAFPVAAPSGASIETVQAMGLPLFLTGQNVQALQTLASSPSLLQTFIDPSGTYDQTRLLQLVQTLTQNLAPSLPGAAAAAIPGFQAPAASAMSSHYGVAATAYQPPSATASTFGIYGGGGVGGGGGGGNKGPYRGDKNEAGNMHVSGYGPTTTEHDIRNLFAPYVNVDEVVVKSNFSFVNTSDPEGAARAKEILNGSLLGGMPIRVNPATRKSSNPSASFGLSAAPVPTLAAPAPRDAGGQIQYDQVRDDRGNVATKNLFVAGYGLGTTEQQLREVFAPHCTVSSIVMKSTFAFVNTNDRIAAIHAREALTGAILAGGALRINFAKETGRLGTSFDSGGSRYGPAGGGRY